MEDEKLVVLERFTNTTEAQRYAALLKSNGIDVFVTNEHSFAIRGGILDVWGPLDLMIRASDLDAARAFLAEMQAVIETPLSEDDLIAQAEAAVMPEPVEDDPAS